MDYLKLVGMISVSKWPELSDILIDFVLASKNDDKMPSPLANSILHFWQRDLLSSESGLAALLEAAVLLEPEKTLVAIEELQLTDVAEQIKEATAKT